MTRVTLTVSVIASITQYIQCHRIQPLRNIYILANYNMCHAMDVKLFLQQAHLGGPYSVVNSSIYIILY